MDQLVTFLCEFQGSKIIDLYRLHLWVPLAQFSLECSGTLELDLTVAVPLFVLCSLCVLLPEPMWM